MKAKNSTFSIIDKGMTLDGTIAGNGNLVINGTVTGTLCGDTLIISEDGCVTADTRATTMTIGGMFEGKLETSGQLIILSTGKCNGEVTCGDLVVEPGAQLNAAVTCKNMRTVSKK
ncbi:polymer-forming cytoskeletal protein [Desulfosarcina sp. OttesenSCG-928-B08]|nr:polymer-forming cytoskeletal protein [Desulfosarcina sp. OttesenSCG-928-B08]